MSADVPLVDVCVLTWNTRDITAEALRRLRDSEQGVPYRLLVRDNGSSDGTADAVRRAFPDADIDAGSDNLGFAAGMNTLLQRATAPNVLVLNGDAWLEPGAVGRMVAALDAHPDAGVVAPRLLRPDGSLEHSTWPFPGLWLSAIYATGVRWLLPSRLAARLLLEPDWQHDRGRYVPWAVGAALLVPRRVLDRVGGFDESFFMYGEDVDWCWRVRDAGYRIWFEPSAVVRHIGGASSEQRYVGAVTVRKAAASARMVTARRGPAVGALFRVLEAMTGIRIWALAKLRGDHAAMTWGKAVARTNLRLPQRERERS